MRRYEFKVILEEGRDEFWENIRAGGRSGCEEVASEVRVALESWGALITLTKFEDLAD